MGVTSVEGVVRLVLDATVVGLLTTLLTTGDVRMGSFLTESEVCRGAWGSRAGCCCPGSDTAGAEASLLPGFSGKADNVVSSVLLPEETGRVGAAAELRRPPNDKVGNDAGRGVAVVAGGGAEGVTILLVCWLPNEKTVLLPLREIPPKLITPEEPALVEGKMPNMLAELLLLVLVDAAGLVVTEEVKGGSTVFPNTGGLVRLKPEETAEALGGWATVRLVAEGLLAGFVESSTGPTRNPEKLPRVSPVKEVGNRSSPNLDDGVSSLPEVPERDIPEGATGLLHDGVASPGEDTAALVVVFDIVIPEGGELSGTVSYKGLLPPVSGNGSSCCDSLVSIAPCVAVKLEDSVDVTIPKLKLVPDGKVLEKCPIADGVEVTAASTLVALSPEALSPDDNGPDATVGPDGFREVCLA